MRPVAWHYPRLSRSLPAPIAACHDPRRSTCSRTRLTTRPWPPTTCATCSSRSRPIVAASPSSRRPCRVARHLTSTRRPVRATPAWHVAHPAPLARLLALPSALPLALPLALPFGLIADITVAPFAGIVAAPYPVARTPYAVRRTPPSPAAAAPAPPLPLTAAPAASQSRRARASLRRVTSSPPTSSRWVSGRTTTWVPRPPTPSAAPNRAPAARFTPREPTCTRGRRRTTR